MITWGVGEGMFFHFQPLYLQDMGADPLKIGTILGLIGLAMTLAYLPAGYLSDRVGRRPMVRLAWIIGTIATVMMSMSKSLPLLSAGMILYGVTSFVTVPLYSYITSARGRLSVGRAVTLNSVFFNLGYIAGPLIGGYIGGKYGLHANFQVASEIFIFSTTFIFFIRPQPVEKPAKDIPAPGMRELWRGSFGRYVVLIFFIVFGLYLPQPLAQNYLQNERGLTLTVIGQLLAVRSIGMVVLSLVIGQLNTKVGFLLSQVSVGLFAIFLWLGTGLPYYFAGYLLVGGYGTARVLAIAQGRSLVQSSNMGVAYGMLESAMATAIVLGPPLAGLLYEYQPEMIYIISLVLIVLGLGANFLYSPAAHDDLKRFENQDQAAESG